MAEVLVVEDRRIDRKWLAALLESEGLGVVEAAGVDEAIERLRDRPVDLIVSELLTPWIDGRDLVFRMRDLPGRAATPVIFYTATVSESDAHKLALACGVIDVVAGAKDRAEMARVVRDVLARGDLGELPSAADSERLRAAADRINRRVRSCGAVGEDHLDGVVALAQGLRPDAGPSALLESVARQIREVTWAERALLHVLSEDGRHVERLVPLGYDTPEWPCPEPLQPGDTLVEVLMQGRHPLRVHVTDSDAAHVLPRGVCARSVLVVPLATARRSVGWIVLADRRDADTFTLQDAESATALGALAAVACEQAGLLARQAAQVQALEQDIEARRQIVEAQRVVEARRRATLAEAGAMTFELELASDRLTWSPQAEEVFGCPRAELPRTGEALLALVDGREREAVADDLQRAVRERVPVTRDLSLRLSGAPPRLLAGHWRADIEPGGQTRVRGFLLDSTERARLEAQRTRDEKMDAVTQLAGAVAHDFNDLLTAILGYSSMADNREPAQALVTNLDEVRRAAERAAGLTRQLLAFSRRQVVQARAVDLNETVDGLGRLLHRMIGDSVDIQTELATEPASVLVDPHQFEQVIVNLAVNARDAMPQGGRLSLATALVDLDLTHARRHAGARPGRYVRLSVLDTGSGMSADVQRHLFEPFFSTKDSGKGAGLGLAMVYGVVRQCGGHVEVQSEPGVGSRFDVYLPAAGAAAADAGEGVTNLPRGRESILVVEDEPAVRALARKVLERAGYRVTDAASPFDAEALFSETPDGIDLLLTDVVMPGMAGPTLYERLSQRQPSLKVLYMSGFTDEKVVRNGMLDNVPFTQKPFTAAALARKIREVLDR